MEFTSSNLPVERECPKLVRDNIPQIIRERGGEPKVRTAASDDEYLIFLFKKMREETAELEHSLVKDNMLEELADVLEVFDAILKLKGWTVADIAAVQQEKRKKNGGFDKRILLIENE